MTMVTFGGGHLASVSFNAEADVVRVLSDGDTGKRVADLEKTYYTINVAQAMKDLTHVGQCLQLA